MVVHTCNLSYVQEVEVGGSQTEASPGKKWARAYLESQTGHGGTFL
jgi:hypothetical protein